MSMDQMAVLLVSNVNESKGHSEYMYLSLTQKDLGVYENNFFGIM